METKRHAIISITPDLLRESLHLPATTRILWALGGTDTGGNIQVVAHDPDFPETSESQQLPKASPRLFRDGDGTVKFLGYNA